MGQNYPEGFTWEFGSKRKDPISTAFLREENKIIIKNLIRTFQFELLAYKVV
jgi:hypothetical protein